MMVNYNSILRMFCNRKPTNALKTLRSLTMVLYIHIYYMHTYNIYVCVRIDFFTQIAWVGKSL